MTSARSRRSTRPRRCRRLSKALKIGGKATKKDTVTEALQEYISRRKQAAVSNLFGTIEYDPKYSYKKQRRRR